MSKDASGATQFDALLAEIQGQGAETETFTKSVNDDAARIDAAAAEAGAEGEGEGEDGKKKPVEGEGGEGAAAAGGEEKFGKSFTMVGEDGKEVQGYDATELLKSLMDRTETLEANSAKGLAAVLGVVKQQGELIKSLYGEVRAMGAQGRGRKAVLAISETAGEDLSKSLQAGADAAAAGGAAKGGISRQEYIQHAQAAAGEGMIEWHSANLAETCLNKGLEPPAEVTAAVARVKARLEAKA
ncbi:MAG TPA: hypothetical protein VJP88_03190 [Caulobacteraceae bacterium]|nr:hypothetical protein [Caulobacteraceae bacterium]